MKRTFTYRVIDQSGDKYEGSPDTIVELMRNWDTSMGRCSTNNEYMRLVTARLPHLPVIRSEIQFLMTLEDMGLITIQQLNKKEN